jgi:hypothetical protein
MSEFNKGIFDSTSMGTPYVPQANNLFNGQSAQQYMVGNMGLDPYQQMMGSGMPGFDSITLPQQQLQTQDPGFWSWKGFMGGPKNIGWGTGLFALANSGLNAYLGSQQLKLAQERFNFQKDSWNKNYETQRKMTNTQMEDRQQARRSFSGSATPVNEYMAKNRI